MVKAVLELARSKGVLIEAAVLALGVEKGVDLIIRIFEYDISKSRALRERALGTSLPKPQLIDLDNLPPDLQRFYRPFYERNHINRDERDDE